MRVDYNVIVRPPLASQVLKLRMQHSLKVSKILQAEIEKETPNTW